MNKATQPIRDAKKVNELLAYLRGKSERDFMIAKMQLNTCLLYTSLISRADWVRQDIQLVVILLLDGGHAAIGVVRIPGDGILLRRPSRIVSGALLYYRAGYQRRGAVLVQIPASKVVSFAGRRSGGRHHDTVPLLGLSLIHI